MKKRNRKIPVRMISTTAAILLAAVLLDVPIGSALMNGNGMVVALAAEQGQAGASESLDRSEGFWNWSP